MNKVLATTIFIITSLSLSAQSLHRTACRGDLVRLDSMLLHHDLDEKDNRGRSILHWAVACKQDSVIHFLLDRGLYLNIEDYQHKTPLHIAAQSNNLKYFDLLVELQKDEQWKSDYGASLFELSILKKDTFLIEKLLNQGIDIHSINDRGSTPLEISNRIKSSTITQYLLDYGADKNKQRKFFAHEIYMGQTDPGSKAKMFAPNFISTEEHEFGSVFNSDGTAFYYGVDVNGKAEIRYTALVDGFWSMPKAILKHERYSYNDPFLSPQEDRLYFISDRALNGIDEAKEDYDIWFVKRTDRAWSDPINAGTKINTAENEYYISFAKNGTMYFATNLHNQEDSARDDHDIYYSEFVDNKFKEAVALGDSINTLNYEADVFIDPDEEYIIFCSIRPDGLGRGDLYINFKNQDGSWSQSINMGESINTVNHELCPYVTTDGKHLFYTSNGDIYWVSTEIIQSLKANVR